MQIKVLAFGIAKEIFGGGSLQTELSDVQTVSALKEQLEEQFPRLRQLSSYMVAVNNEYAQPAMVLKAGDEVAIIPPVSGG